MSKSGKGKVIFDNMVNDNRGGYKLVCPECGALFSRPKDFYEHTHEKKREDSTDRKERLQHKIYAEDWEDKYPAGLASPLRGLISALVSGGFRSPQRGVTFWQCPFADREEFKSADEFEYHLVQRHGDELANYLANKLGMVGKSLYGENERKNTIDRILEDNKFVRHFRNGGSRTTYRCPLDKVKGSYETVFEHMLKHREADILSQDKNKPKEDEDTAINYLVRQNKHRTPDGDYFYRCPVDGYRFKKPQEFSEHLHLHTPEVLQENMYHKNEYKVGNNNPEEERINGW